MAKIIHVADLHLGASFSFLPENQAKQAQEKQLEALRSLVQMANDRQTDALLMAGDLFEEPAASGALVRDVFFILGKCRCPVFIAPGNHDYYDSSSPYQTASLPENLHVFTTRVLEGVPLADGQTVIYGAAFEEDSSYISLEATLDPLKLNLCCVHGDLIRTDSAYNPIQPREISDSGFAYLAAGHNHQSSGLRKAGKTYYACPGSFCALTARETGRHGYLIGEVTRNDVKLSFVQTQTIQLKTMEVDVSDIFSDASLQEKIAVHMPEERENTCLSLHLCGTKNYEIGVKALKRALDRAFFCCLFRDETHEPADLWEGIQENDLRGAVLRRMRADLKNADRQNREKILRAAQYLQSAMMD